MTENPTSTNAPEPADDDEINPPLPDPGPRDGTHTHDGVSPTDPDVGDAFADGFQHPEK